jgi:RNA polymerase sigma-70 factor, ECF subfamily
MPTLRLPALVTAAPARRAGEPARPADRRSPGLRSATASQPGHRPRPTLRPVRRGAEPTAQAPAPRVLDGDALSRHLDRLYRAALSLCGSPADADDLVQEVCLRALSKPRLIRGADDLPYLLQMLRNVFYNQCRTQASRKTAPVEPETLNEVPDGRRHDPELGALARDVHRAIAALPTQYREVVVAVDVLGLPYADAAAALGVPVGTVMSRLHRGRHGVARAMGDVLAAA